MDGWLCNSAWFSVCVSIVTEDMTLVEDFDAFQCATFNPVEPCLIATGSSRHGTALYDTRTRKK